MSCENRRGLSDCEEQELKQLVQCYLLGEKLPNISICRNKLIYVINESVFTTEEKRAVQSALDKNKVGILHRRSHYRRI